MDYNQSKAIASTIGSLADAVTLEDGAYIDFSCNTDGNYATGRRLEVGDDRGNVAVIDMSLTDLRRLHRALSLTLAIMDPID